MKTASATGTQSKKTTAFQCEEQGELRIWWDWLRKGLLLGSGVKGMVVDSLMEMHNGALRKERREKKGGNATWRGEREREHAMWRGERQAKGSYWRGFPPCHERWHGLQRTTSLWVVFYFTKWGSFKEELTGNLKKIKL